MVGAGRFELPTPGPPGMRPNRIFAFCYRELTRLSKPISGLTSGLLEAFQRRSHLVINNVGVSRGCLYVSVTQRLLNHLEVASGPQELGCQIMPKIMEPE